MKTTIKKTIARIAPAMIVLAFIPVYSGVAHAQTPSGAWTPGSGSSTTTYATPTPATANPTTTGLQYTGTYCSNFTTTLQLSSKSIGDLFHFITCLIEVSIIPLLFAIAVLVFIYGVVKFIGTEESAEKEDGKQFMLWGIVALAVMFSVWGLVRTLGNTFGVSNIIPQLPTNAK